MDIIHEQLAIEIGELTAPVGSYCEVSREVGQLLVTYYLSSEDCFFAGLTSSYRIRFRLSPDYLARFGETLHLRPRQKILCCQTQLQLCEIVRCRERGLSRKLFLEARFLNLLHRLVAPELPDLGCANCERAGGGADAERVEAARTFILQNLDERITIPIIATAVGTNQCYLKRGFKDTYGQTIFEFIQEHRLTRAKFLIETTDAPLAEVAARVGYASASSFGQAFRNYFGASPSAFSHS